MQSEQWYVYCTRSVVLMPGTQTLKTNNVTLLLLECIFSLGILRQQVSVVPEETFSIANDSVTV